uniref:Exonuclease domain-containing protein n=1 Tax=Trichobilharzia regenti TaxID=157069 RepID=A0AA85K610_TRIRE|nr:unnamed protein product [Trichobilharzia regenti]
MKSLLSSSRPIFLSTLVLFDVETTGLPSANFKPEITELCMLASSRFNLETATEEPRVENKLTLCFNPTRTISSIASKISGLNADNLFHQKDFDSSAVDLIQLFLNRLDSPVCLIAHNGLRFDFPLLKAQIMSVKGKNYNLNDCTNAPIICTDTLHLFREFASQLSGTNSDDSGFISTDDQSASPVPISHSSPKKLANTTTTTTTNKHSFHLADVYERVFGEKHKNAHSAEGDCRAMLRLIQYLGSPAIDWLQSHYQNFNSLAPMYTLPASNSSRLSLSSSIFPYQRTTQSYLDSRVDNTTSLFDDLQLE